MLLGDIRENHQQQEVQCLFPHSNSGKDWGGLLYGRSHTQVFNLYTNETHKKRYED